MTILACGLGDICLTSFNELRNRTLGKIGKGLYKPREK